MKFAWSENNVIRDVCPGNPSECYTSEIAAYYTTEVNDEIINGATLVNGTWINPALVTPMPEIQFVRIWDSLDFRKCLNLSERVKWDNDTSALTISVCCSIADWKAPITPTSIAASR